MDRILIFDFDGVLADSLEPMLNYAEQVCQELGYECSPSQQDLEALERMEFSEFGRQLGIPEGKIDTFVNRNFELFSRREKPLAITPGIDSVIRELSQLAILTVITGNSCQVVERFLEAYELNGEFQTILGAEDAGRRLEKILKIVSLHGRLNSEVYMIGDAVSDIHTAREAEIKSIAVGWGHQSMEKLIKETPDFMVSHPGDLLALFTD